MPDDTKPQKTRLINAPSKRRRAGLPSSDLRELWRDGIPLGDAWSMFAENDALDKWRNATDERSMRALGLLMQGDLLAELRDGDLTAIGIRETSAPYAGPEIIPADLFDASLESVRSIFPDTSRLALAGKVWVQVTVTERRWIPSSNKPSSDDGDAQRPNKKMGRPSKSAVIKKILQEMSASGWDLNTNQKRLCAEVIRLASKRGVPTGSGFSEPVIKTAIRNIRDDRGS